MTTQPSTRKQVFEALKAAFPDHHWGLSEEGGWNEGYLIHVEPEDEDFDDTDRILGADDPPAPKSQLVSLLSRIGWSIHRFDADSRLYFLAPIDDEDPSLEGD